MTQQEAENSRTSLVFGVSRQSVEEQFLSGQAESPSAIYFELSRLYVALSGCVVVETDNTFLSESDLATAKRDTEAALAYSVAYRSFCSDTFHNDTVQLQLLAGYVDSLLKAKDES